MIQVKGEIKENGYIISSSGHASHDVCVSISAIINTLRQYVEDQERYGNAKINEIKYKFGETLIDFDISNESRQQIIADVIKAFMQGIKLYQNEFPDEIRLWEVSSFWWGYPQKYTLL